jgi:4-amino-4-deoxy-L-arabinose transferase-like glycosyltransferase
VPRFFERRLATIAGAGLALRLVYVVAVRTHSGLPAPDAYLYHYGANLLAQGKGFIDPYVYRQLGLIRPAADHPPAYMLYLTIFSVLGFTSPLAHMLASTVLGTAAVVMVGLVGREVGGPRVGLLAAGLAAGFLDLVLVDGSLQSESMAVLAVTALVYAALRYRHHPTVRAAAGLGAILGWAGMTRPEQFVLGLLVIVPVVRRACSDRRAAWVRIGTAAAACIVIALPWLVMNLVRFDHPVLLSSNLEYTLETTNCDLTWYGRKIGFWDNDCDQAVLNAHHLTFADSDQSDRGDVYRQAALDYLSHHLSRLPVVVAARVLRMANLWDPVTQADLDTQVEGREHPWAVLAIVSFYVVAGLAVVGARRLRRQHHSLVELGGPILTVLAMAAVFMGNARYRAPAEGVLCVFAAVGIEAIRVRRERRRTAPTSPTGA